jgi:hypothetical protein
MLCCVNILRTVRLGWSSWRPLAHSSGFVSSEAGHRWWWGSCYASLLKIGGS